MDLTRDKHFLTQLGVTHGKTPCASLRIDLVLLTDKLFIVLCLYELGVIPSQFLGYLRSALACRNQKSPLLEALIEITSIGKILNWLRI